MHLQEISYQFAETRNLETYRSEDLVQNSRVFAESARIEYQL